MELTIAKLHKKEKKTANKRQYFKEYYQRNIDKFKQYAQQKIKFYCPVCDISVYNMPIHFKSKKHKAHFDKSEPIEMKELNVEGINLENL